MFYPLIVIICYIIATLLKRTSLAKEWLPLLSAGTGALLAVLGYCTLPQLTTADTMLTAAFYGVISGLAATGGNQVFKQAVKLFCKNHGLDYSKLDQYLPSDGTEGQTSGAGKTIVTDDAQSNTDDNLFDREDMTSGEEFSNMRKIGF